MNNLSLITTVKNEMTRLPEWLESLLQQTKTPQEIVIVDGGSTDGTWEYLQGAAQKHTQLVVLRHSGNISEGRNAAIAQAQGTIIAVADAGCVYDPTWLAQLVAPFAHSAEVCATGFGPFLTKDHTLWQLLIAAATTPHPAEFQNDWLPSSRSVAFTKALWEEVGGYPTWLPICEDLLFDIALFEKTDKKSFVRTPLVFWEPRPTVRAYMKQLFRYTRGDGHAHIHTARNLLRYAVYGAAVFFLFFQPQPLWLWGGVLLFALLYMAKYLRRLVLFSRHYSIFIRAISMLLLPCIVALGDSAKMAGWPVGLLDRARGTITPNRE